MAYRQWKIGDLEGAPFGEGKGKSLENLKLWKEQTWKEEGIFANLQLWKEHQWRTEFLEAVFMQTNTLSYEKNTICIGMTELRKFEFWRNI